MLHLNKDKKEIAILIYDRINKTNPAITLDNIITLISNYERLILSHVFTEWECDYRFTIPTVGTIRRNVAANKKPSALKKARASKYNYFRKTFNEIYLHNNSK